jgi:hypothetical protein
MEATHSTPEDLQLLLNERLKHPHYDSYDLVRFLGLFWEDGDKAYRAESEKLKNYFEKTFGFVDGETFPIPSQDSHLALAACIDQGILNMNKCFHDRQSGLLIIHYGGHGDENANESKHEKQRCVWAA